MDLAHSFATIANFQWFSKLPSPLNGMVEGNHWDQWFSDGFGVRQPLVTMVFDGCAPLVRRWNGYVPSLKSIPVVASFFPLFFLGTFPIWFKTSTLKENCLSNYCWGKKRRKKTNISPFPATHTYIKLTFVSFFQFFFAPFP